MFNLSGAINVVLFLIVRPELLLFGPPERADESEAQMPQLITGPIIVPDTAQFNHSPETTGIGGMDGSEERSWNFTFEGSGTQANHEAPYDVGSTQIPNDI
jgi:hypothetical protein